jgi:hypothetical protein
MEATERLDRIDTQRAALERQREAISKRRRALGFQHEMGGVTDQEYGRRQADIKDEETTIDEGLHDLDAMGGKVVDAQAVTDQLQQEYDRFSNSPMFTTPGLLVDAEKRKDAHTKEWFKSWRQFFDSVGLRIVVQHDGTFNIGARMNAAWAEAVGECDLVTPAALDPISRREMVSSSSLRKGLSEIPALLQSLYSHPAHLTYGRSGR